MLSYFFDIENPFFIKKKDSNTKISNINAFVLVKKYNSDINDKIFSEKIITKKELCELYNNLILYELPIYKFEKFYDILIIAKQLKIKKDILNNVNYLNYKLDEENLVIFKTEFDIDNIITLFNNSFENILKSRKINFFMKNYHNIKLYQNIISLNDRFNIKLNLNFLLNNKNIKKIIDSLSIIPVVTNKINDKDDYYYLSNNIFYNECYKILEYVEQREIFYELKKEIILLMMKNNDDLKKKNCDILIKSYHYFDIIIKNNEYFDIILNSKDLKKKITYLWIIMIYKELVNYKSFSNSDYVLDIENASKLPIFDTDLPYLPFVWKNTNYNQNNYYKGICNIEEFKLRLNYFVSKKNINIFKDIDFINNNIVICGSVMSACSIKNNRLINDSWNEKKFVSFLNKCYNNSDLDIMIFHNTINKYIITVEYLYNKIKENIKMFLDHNDIILSVKIIKIEFTDNDICNDKNLIIKKIHNYIKNNSMDMIFKYIDKNYFETNYDDIILNNSNNTIFDMKIKFYIKCDNIRTIEIFNIPYIKDPMERISTFHLPCVRSYYNNHNVFLLPSCITSYLTYVNMNLNYINSNNIFYKYSLRGFDFNFKTIENNKDKSIFYNDIVKIDEIDIKNNSIFIL